MLYDTTFSERGVLQCVGRQPRKANPFDFQIPMQVGAMMGQSVHPNCTMVLASGGVAAGCAAAHKGRHCRRHAPWPAVASCPPPPARSTTNATACYLPMHMHMLRQE